MDKQRKQLHNETEWIGIILKDETLWEDRTVDNFHFYTKINKNIYQLMKRFKNEGKAIEYNTFYTLSDKEIDLIGGLDYIEECKNNCTNHSIDNFKRIESDLHTYHVAQSMINRLKEIEKKDSYDLEECRSIIQSLNDVSENVKKNRLTFQDLLMQTHEKMMNMPDGLSGIDSGYPSINEAFDGWQQKDLLIVAARPSMGKTAITVNFMLHAAAKDNHVVYIPAETGNESIIKRSIAVMGNMPVNVMRNPKKHLDDEGLKHYQKVLSGLSKLPLHIEKLNNIRDIKQLIREQRKSIGDKKMLVIIDHLAHLSDGQQHINRTHELESYCNQLKEIAIEYDCCMMLLSQLSREVEKRPDKRPMMSDIRDSGAVEQIADVIAFLYRESYYIKDEDKKPERDIIDFIVSKNRDGSLGSIKFEFIPETNRVKEYREDE